MSRVAAIAARDATQTSADARPSEPVLAATRPPDRHQSRRRGVPPSRWLPPTVTAVALVALVQILVGTNVISPDRIPLPTDVMSSLADQILTAEFWSAIGASLRGWA